MLEEHFNGDYPDQPLFMVYSPPNAHTPIQYHVSHDTECKNEAKPMIKLREEYCSLIQEFDVSIGGIVDKLKQYNEWEKTILIYTSDNGGLVCYEVGSSQSCSGSINSPLRGGKQTLFDGGLRVRSFISGGYLPESKRGTYIDSFVHSIDIPATIAMFGNINDEIYNNNIDGIKIFDNNIDFNINSELINREYIVIDLNKNKEKISACIIYKQRYKYLVSPTDDDLFGYDGWWNTPIKPNKDNIPTKSKPFTSSGNIFTLNNNNNTTNISNNNSTSFDSIFHDEYIFDIIVDASETNNIIQENMNLLNIFRDIIRNKLNNDNDYMETQEYLRDERSDPSLYDGIWKPFE